jgi:tetratricopeptide (TPR) repeat protein
MTMRESADNLFDRIMTCVSAGDSTGAQMFLPMALGAYDQAQPLDHDGLFHLSLLNRVAGNLEVALANATQVLDVDPNHVLALSAAGEAAAEMGRTEDATAYYGHLLDVLDAEIARALPEYVAHGQIMESVRADAAAYLAGR